MFAAEIANEDFTEHALGLQTILWYCHLALDSLGTNAGASTLGDNYSKNQLI